MSAASPVPDCLLPHPLLIQAYVATTTLLASVEDTPPPVLFLALCLMVSFLRGLPDDPVLRHALMQPFTALAYHRVTAFWSRYSAWVGVQDLGTQVLSADSAVAERDLSQMSGLLGRASTLFESSVAVRCGILLGPPLFLTLW